MAIALKNYVKDQAGDPKAGLTVNAYDTTALTVVVASDTTDANGEWEITGLDSTKTWATAVIDGVKKVWFDARAKLQLTILDIVGSLTVDTINEHTAANGINVDGLLIKDTNVGVANIQMVVVEFSTDVATGDGQFYLHIPTSLNGMNLTAVHARVITAGTTGTTDIQIANVTDITDMLSVKLTIDSGETSSNT